METFFGLSASSETGIGTAFIIPETIKPSILNHRIEKDFLENGWNRFLNAKQAVSEHILNLLNSLSKTDEKDKIQREIFETYILMLEDAVFIKELKEFYEKELFNITYSVDFKSKEYADKLCATNDEYLSLRAKDILDVYSMVIYELLDIHPFDINTVPDNSVIVAASLNASDTIILSKRKIQGLILSESGINSHVVILARNYGIPTVVGIENISKKIKTGETVIVDSKNAKIIVSPVKDLIDDYKNQIQKEYEHSLELKKYLNKKAVSKDGVEFNLYANIGSIQEAQTALENGADGIGLFRTEFLFMQDASSPIKKSIDEEEQFLVYKKILEMMKDKPVTIRTLDAGGDKIIRTADIPFEEETNPLMGLRAVRLSLLHPALLKTQLRALYRASVFGNLKIMFPLISTYNQVEKCLKIIEEVKAELKQQNIPFKNDVPVGLMIETASAAIISDKLSRITDFFCIGTNDLTQYTLAVDRENSNVSLLYNEFDISVLRLIQKTITSANDSNIHLSVCGEMAGKKNGALILAGLGIRNLSMSPKMLLEIKDVLSQLTISEMESLAAKNLE